MIDRIAVLTRAFLCVLQLEIDNRAKDVVGIFNMNLRTIKALTLSIPFTVYSSEMLSSTQSLKGPVSPYLVIFFARAKNGDCSRKCRGHAVDLAA